MGIFQTFLTPMAQEDTNVARKWCDMKQYRCALCGSFFLQKAYRVFDFDADVSKRK